jgi:hypothetical protein
MAQGSEPLSPEEYAYLLQLGSMDTDLANALQMQMEMAKNMRVNSAPETQMYGRVAVAPHPLALAGGLARNYTANQMQQRGLGMQHDMTQNRHLQNQMIMRAILTNGARFPNMDPTQAGTTPAQPNQPQPNPQPGVNPFLDGGP